MIAPIKVRSLPVLLAGLAMLGPFTINIYMPSFEQMKMVFAVTDIEMQVTLSLYFTAFAFMSLWHGAFSDSLGRRPVVIAGLVVFVVASIGAANATKIEHIYVCRVLQGMSAGAGIVVGRAVIRDLYSGAAAQQLYSLVVMLFALAPAVGPVLGGWVQLHAGWGANFVLLATIGIVLLVMVVTCLSETLPQQKRQRLSIKALLAGYSEVLGNRSFMLWAVTFALMFAGFFIYVVSAPVFLIRHLNMDEKDFIWLFGPATVGMMLGSYMSSRLAQYRSNRHCLIAGFTIMAVASFWNLSICYWAPEFYGWYLPYLFIYTFGMALVQPTIVLAGLDCVPERRGLGASLQLFIQTGFNAVLAAIIAPLFWHTTLLLAVGAALAMVLSLLSVAIIWGISERNITVHPAR